MSVNHAKEFLKYVLYFHTFLSELQMAASIPISGISVPNLEQGHLSKNFYTCQDGHSIVNIYSHIFQKSCNAVWYR